MKALALEQSAVMRNIGLHSDIKAMQIDEDRAGSLGRMYDEGRERMSRLGLTASEREILEALNKADKEIDKPFQQALGLSTSFRNEEAAKVLMNEVDPLVQKTLLELSRLIALQTKANQEATQTAMVNGDRLAATVYVVEAIVLLVAVLIAWTTTRSITGPLAEALGVARRVAAGDLTSRIEVKGRDEAAELLAALRDMNGGLSRMVAQIRSGAESIAVGAGQVAAGTQQLSSRTEEHASSLEETASTLEEFTTTVRQNAEHAKQASALAGSASATAQKGGEVVTRVVSTFQEVTDSSKRITDIIGVIDGIAFQTNILALNAAVEAALAGEQGRGFAVVASEVRGLAQRSATAAKEIKGLIDDSGEKVDGGSALVDEAGQTMGLIVSSVSKGSQLIGEIANATNEQSAGLTEANSAVSEPDKVTQQNAALVEESTAASESLRQLAEEMVDAVSVVRVSGDERRSEALAPIRVLPAP